MIIPRLVGKTILVHTGNRFTPVRVQEVMVGHRLGEFAITRKAKVTKVQRKLNAKPRAPMAKK